VQSACRRGLLWSINQSGIQPQDDYDRAAIVARLRSRFLGSFDAAYVDHVILPHFLVSMYRRCR
jgi:hypothetical protein